MANYMLSILWNMLPWNGERPTTAVALAQACNIHIQQKQAELALLREEETTKTDDLTNATAVTQEAKSAWEKKKQELNLVIRKMEDRFRTVRNAINITFECQTDQKDTVNSLYQLCTMVGEFSKQDFQSTVEEQDGAISRAKQRYDRVQSIESEMRTGLQQIVYNTKVVENHIKELGQIKLQLDKRLNDKTVN